MYLDSALDSRPGGIRARRMAENLGEPVADIIAACEKLNKIDLLRIDHTYREKDKVTDIEMHILSEGASVLFENLNYDIWD